VTKNFNTSIHYTFSVSRFLFIGTRHKKVVTAVFQKLSNFVKSCSHFLEFMYRQSHRPDKFPYYSQTEPQLKNFTTSFDSCHKTYLPFCQILDSVDCFNTLRKT